MALVNGLVAFGAFGKHFPKECSDRQGVYSTDAQALKLAINGEVPGIEYPLITEKIDEDNGWEKIEYSPNYLTVLDFIQFCYEYVSKPIQSSYHDFYSHYHLRFDCDEGKEEFRQKINSIFSRNGISYELEDNGNFIRLAPEVLSEALHAARFNTPDSTLNRMLEESRSKFLSPDETARRESLERLWDAWERIKTVLKPDNKKESAKRLLDNSASDVRFRSVLEEDANTLTNIGNDFLIRHTEVGKVEIKESAQIDYLFHRLFSLILLVSKKNNWE